MKARTLSATLLVGVSLLAPAYVHALSGETVPRTRSEVESIQELLGSRFAPTDVDRLLEHIKNSALGKHTLIPSDLKRRLRAAASDLRLEYGFQMAVLLARWKKTVPQLGAVDLDELFQQINRALDE